MRNETFRKLRKRLLAGVLALAQCLSLSGCILGEGRVDLPMAPMVTVPLVNTSKTVKKDDIRKFMVPGKNAFYILPGIESDPQEMVDFQCFDYTTEGEFIYMYSAPSYIDGETLSAYKGTEGTAPEEGTTLPDRENGIQCDALIVMTYNPYTMHYRVLDAQAYSREETTQRLSETEYYKGDGFYMLANAYGGKIGEQERYFVMDRAGTAVVYAPSGEAVFESALSALIKPEIDKLIAFYYLDENGNRKKKEEDDDDSGDEDADAKKEAQEEVQNETGNDSEEPKTENFGVSERAKKAGVSVLLKSAVMDANNMTYCSVMLFDKGSPWDPDSEIHEEIVNCYALALDSAAVNYLSYNKEWPKQQAEWMKLDNKTISVQIDESADTLANAVNTIQKTEIGKPVTMGELIGNNITTLQRILGIDSIKTGDSASSVNRTIAKQFLNIDLADVHDDYSPFIMGQESGFPSFIAGWTDIGSSAARQDAISAGQDKGYELTKEEQIFNQWMDEDVERLRENYARQKRVYGDYEGELKAKADSLSGYWAMLDHLANSKKKVGDLSTREKRLFDDIGAIKVLVDNKEVGDAGTLFRYLWNGGTALMENKLYKRKYWWFIKLGYRKAGTQAILWRNGFSNNWKRSVYAGAYQYFRQNLGVLPDGADYSVFDDPKTGTGYDGLKDGRLYVQMNSLDRRNLTPKPGVWKAASRTNVSPFAATNIEMLYAYHESVFKGRMQETSAMICEVPSKAEGLGHGVYDSSTMSPYAYNEEMNRIFHVDFSEKLSTAMPVLKSLPYLGIADPETQIRGTVSEATNYMEKDSHWRDALTVYERERMSNRDRRLYDHLTASIAETQVSHQVALQAALTEVMRDRERKVEDNKGQSRWETYPSDFNANFEEIYEAMRRVAENIKNVEYNRINYIKTQAGEVFREDWAWYWKGASYYKQQYRDRYAISIEMCYAPINELSEKAQAGYREFRDACIRYGVGDFLTVYRPAGMTDQNEVYAGITRPDPNFRDQNITYKFYYDEDAWWDVDDNWAAFVNNTLIPSGSYTDDEIGAILDIHKGLIHIRETIPRNTIPTVYKLKFPEGSTANFATSSEQSGTATAAPEEGVILYMEQSLNQPDGEKYYSGISYIYPREANPQSFSDMMNLFMSGGSSDAGLGDVYVPGSAIDAGYINYRDEKGEISQIIVLATSEGVKFYPGVKQSARKNRPAWFKYSRQTASYVTNEELLTSTGYTASVQQQTAATMAKRKTTEDPSSGDETQLDIRGQLQVARDATESLKEAVKAIKGDEEDEEAGEEQSEQVQEILNAARVGTLASVESFTMTGEKEVLISACDTGLSLFNINTKAVVPVAGGSYFKSYRVKTKKNEGAETDAVLEEQAKSKEQSYKILGFNNDEFEYSGLDIARAKVYDLDLAGGKQVAYEQAVKQEVTQRAIDYIRLPLQTKVNDKGEIEAIPMTADEKKKYADYQKLFDPNSEETAWKAELGKVAKDIGLLAVSDSLIAYTGELRQRVMAQSQTMKDIYALLGLRDEDIKLNQAYWNNVALRLSTAVERDSLESILVEIRMHPDVVKHLDKDTQKRYKAYREIFDISEEQGAVELEDPETIAEKAENLGENPTTNTEVLRQGLEENGDVHDYMTEVFGPAGESERNKRGDYYNSVIADIKALIVVLHGLRKAEDILPPKKEETQSASQGRTIDESTVDRNKGKGTTNRDILNNSNNQLSSDNKTEEEQEEVESFTLVFTETEEADYQSTLDNWLTDLNPDNFREEMDEVLMVFVNLVNMGGARIPTEESAKPATETTESTETGTDNGSGSAEDKAQKTSAYTLLNARKKRIREAMPKIDSVAEIEALIISEQVLLDTYKGFYENYKEWNEGSYQNRADRVAKLKTTNWYQTIINDYQSSTEVQEFLKQQDMTWEAYLKSVVLRCGKGVVYDDAGKVEGGTVDVDAATEYYDEYGTLDGFNTTADIGAGAEGADSTIGENLSPEEQTAESAVPGPATSGQSGADEPPSGYPGVGR